jgi:rhodanese-related sulfurtransferase
MSASVLEEPEALARAREVAQAAALPFAGTALNRNPRFAKERDAKVAPKSGNELPALLLCRSGKRSALAAEAAVKAGRANVFHVQEGLDGDSDDQQQRGRFNGWRFHALPWIQD